MTHPELSVPQLKDFPLVSDKGKEETLKMFGLTAETNIENRSKILQARTDNMWAELETTGAGFMHTLLLHAYKKPFFKAPHVQLTPKQITRVKDSISLLRKL